MPTNPTNLAITLVSAEGASLSSGRIQFYAQLPSLDSQDSTPFVGCVDLYNYDPVNRRVAVGIMVANEYRRQGYALAMLHELERMFPSTLHLLYADIAAPNTASVALFRKAGYTECGHFKEWLEYDSHFIDNIRMQKIL